MSAGSHAVFPSVPAASAARNDVINIFRRSVASACVSATLLLVIYMVDVFICQVHVGDVT